MTEPQLQRDPLSTREFDSYFALLSRLLRLSRSQTEDVASELRDHLSLRFAELVDRGVDHDDAIQQALEEFGDAAALAADFVSVREQSRRRWMMRAGIGSVSVCLVALVLTSLFWPEGGNEVAPAPAVAQDQPKKPVVTDLGTQHLVKAESKAKSDEQARNEATEEKLEKKMTAEFIETPLQDVIDFVSSATGAQFYIDKKALDEVGIDGETPVTFKLKEVPTSFILELMLKELDLGYHIRHGVVFITTPEALENEMETRVYDVRDLVEEAVKASEKPARVSVERGGFFGSSSDEPVETSKPAVAGAAENAVPGIASPFVGGGLRGYSVPGGPDYDSLIDLITSTVTPTAWEEVGGPAAVSPFKRLLVISHTDEGHRKVSKLLKDIRDVLNEKK